MWTQSKILLIYVKFLCRRRSFALFFAGGEDEQVVRQHVGDCRPWPPQFRGKKAHCGLAGAAVVSVRKEIEDTSKPARANILEPSSLSGSCPLANMQ